jgi:hypothetical protein
MLLQMLFPQQFNCRPVSGGFLLTSQKGGMICQSVTWPCCCMFATVPVCYCAEVDVAHLSTQQKQQLLRALHQQLQQVMCSAVTQHPSLAPLLTYQQQPQQGWIAQGSQCTAAAAAANASSASAGHGSCVAGANASRGANLAVQAGRAAAAAAGGRGGKSGSSKRSR